MRAKACLASSILALILAIPACAADNPVSQILGPGEGRKFGGGGGENRVLVDVVPGEEEAFSVMEAIMPMGFKTPWAMHFHTHFDEFSYVIEGGPVVVDLPDGSQREIAGDAVFYAPRTHPHHVTGPKTTPARMLSVTTAGQVASFKDAWPYGNDPEKLKDYLATTGTFLADDTARQNKAGATPLKVGYEIVLPGEGRKFTAGGAKVRVLADVPKGATRTHAVLDITYAAGYAGWPLYTSCTFDELWYVLDGTILVDVSGEQKPVSKGGAVYSRHGTPHHLSVPASSPARVFTVVTAGQLAAIEAAGAEKDPPKLSAILAKHRIYPAGQANACAKAS